MTATYERLIRLFQDTPDSPIAKHAQDHDEGRQDLWLNLTSYVNQALGIYVQ